MSPERLQWVNPRELAALENNKQLGTREEERARNQKSLRSKSVEAIAEKQARKEVYHKSLDEVIKELRDDPTRRRSKDTVVLPPPQEEVQLVFEASTDRDNRDVIVHTVQLVHRR